MSNLLVIGHINPDSDTICSAIAEAWLKTQLGQPAEAVRAGELNKETNFILSHFKVTVPRLIETFSAQDTVVIVDTNNPEELPPSITEAHIVEIVDHHKLVGGISTPEPISITVRPVACTATIILEQMESYSIWPSKEIAGIMLASLLSDTLNLTSPTTTELDKVAIQKLEKIAEIAKDELAEQMFAAKSDLTGVTPLELVTADSKAYQIGDKKLLVAVHETTKPANALALQDQIFTAMSELKAKEGYAGIFLYVVDILNSASNLLLPTPFEQETAAKAYNTSVSGTQIYLPGVVSRKKQMVPNLEKALSE